jgi:hypothetical protein
MSKKTPHVKTFALDHSENGHQDIRRRLKFESELDRDFKEKIAEVAHGEQLFRCISAELAAQPARKPYMDYTPQNNTNGRGKDSKKTY